LKKKFLYLQIAIGCLILIVLLFSFDLEAFTKIEIELFSYESLVIFLLLIACLLPRALRWQLLMNEAGDGRIISFSQSLKFLLVGSALNLIMPAGAGDVAKSYFGYRWTGIKERMVAVSLYDKLLAIASLAFLCLYAFIKTGDFVFILAGVASVLPILFFKSYHIFHKKPRLKGILFRMGSLVKHLNIGDVLDQMRFSFTPTAIALVLSIIGWLLDYCLLFYCFHLFDTKVHFFSVLSYGPIMTLGRLFPFTLNGIGSDEALMIYLFSKSDVFPEITFIVAILYRFVVMFIPAFFGLYYLYFTKEWKFNSHPVIEMDRKAETEFIRCTRCVLDTSVPELTFDENGVCQYCKIYDELNKLYPLDDTADTRLNDLIREVKAKGGSKKYDCIVGVSGGTDSTYTLLTAVKHGLRPLAVHFDNGWNSRVAVANIKKACNKFNVDLFTYVVDWEEFKDLQKSFLKASTSDAETPTDVGILSTLFRVADKEKIKYILYGHSFRTEGIAPIGWTYYDGKYIKGIQKRFGKLKLKTFPNFTLTDFVYYNYFKRLCMIPILNYVDYNKAEAKNTLRQELDWEDSGGHHHESIYTHFFHSFMLPEKFNIDKRKVQLSAQVLSRQIPRSEALATLATRYPVDERIVAYAIEKLGLSKEEFEQIMNDKPKSFKNYPSYLRLLKLFKGPFKIAHDLKIIPELLYLKYKNIL
jgi:N-acetyl sugar amidotransferase